MSAVRVDDASFQGWERDELNGGKVGFLGVMPERAKGNTHEHGEKGAMVKLSRWLLPLSALHYWRPQ